MNLLPDRTTSQRAALGHCTFHVAATEGPVALRQVQGRNARNNSGVVSFRDAPFAKALLKKAL